MQHDPTRRILRKLDFKARHHIKNFMVPTNQAKASVRIWNKKAGMPEGGIPAD